MLSGKAVSSEIKLSHFPSFGSPVISSVYSANSEDSADSENTANYALSCSTPIFAVQMNHNTSQKNQDSRGFPLSPCVLFCSPKMGAFWAAHHNSVLR